MRKGAFRAVKLRGGPGLLKIKFPGAEKKVALGVRAQRVKKVVEVKAKRNLPNKYRLSRLLPNHSLHIYGTLVMGAV
jgi:hypothetical protein